MSIRLISTFCASVFVIAVSGSAFAADLARKMPVKAPPPPPPAPVFSWTGFYIGGNAGYDWNNNVGVSSSFTCPAGLAADCPVTVPANLANITAAASQSISANGFTGGIQAGYNWQNGGLVLGIESDFDAFKLKGSRSEAVPSTTTSSIFNPSTSVDTDWLFTLRGRLGWAVVPTVLLYGTGGLAVTDAKVSNSYTTTNNPSNVSSGASSHSETRAGWTAGGGIEWAFAYNWSVKVEYLFVDFGSISTSANVGDPTFANQNLLSTSVDVKANIVRAGINYRFY